MSTSDNINEQHVAEALLDVSQALDCLRLCIRSTEFDIGAVAVVSCVVSKLEESVAHLDRPWLEGGAS